MISLQENLFDHNISRLEVFARLRYLVMCTRSLPHHYSIKFDSELSKLKFLLQATLNDPNPDVNSKSVRDEAIAIWSKSNFVSRDFDFPQASQWMGDPNGYALELFATLCFESQDDITKKIEEYTRRFEKSFLDRDEALAEVYFRTWERYILYYQQEKTQFIDSLMYGLAKFPRSIYLTKLLAKHISKDIIAIQNFFLTSFTSG